MFYYELISYITHNTYKHTLLNNIKAITIMTTIKLRDYYSLTNEGNTKSVIKSWTEPFDHFEGCGPYKVVYKRYIPTDHFGLNNWKSCLSQASATFYKNDIALFKKDVYKDVLFFHTLFDSSEVRFIINELDGINVYSFGLNGESDTNPIKIKSNICIGPDCIVGFQKVSPKYAIALTEELCTYSPFGSIFDLDKLMFEADGKKIKSYNNFRTAMPIYNDEFIRYVPIEATPTGFVIWDIVNKVKLAEILSYDDAYADKFDFWEPDADEQAETQLQNCLSFLGVNIKLPDEAVLDDMLIQHGTVSIPLTPDNT